MSLASCGSLIEMNDDSPADPALTVMTTSAAALSTTAAAVPEPVTETSLSQTQKETVTSAHETNLPKTVIPDGDSSSGSEDEDAGAQEGEKEKKPKSDKITSPASAAYALYCVDDHELIAGKALDKKISLASTTKLLTASVMLRHFTTDAYVTVGQEVYYANAESTMSYLQPGTEISVYDLLAAMLLPSGNDAAYTVAVNTARAASGDEYMSDDDAIAYFCGLMNDLAAELGMKHSHFANPEGWDDPEHYTTLNDMLKLAEYALSEPTLRDITSTFQWEFNNAVSGYLLWTNTNLFIDPYSYYYRDDCIGIKTGTTSDAGCCLISAFEIDGKTYICAVMGCNENEDRYILAGKILEKYLPADETETE